MVYTREEIPDDVDICRCRGGDFSYKLIHKKDCMPVPPTGKCSSNCWMWVHSECEKQSRGFVKECKECGELYAMWTPYDEDTLTCYSCAIE